MEWTLLQSDTQNEKIALNKARHFANRRATALAGETTQGQVINRKSVTQVQEMICTENVVKYELMSLFISDRHFAVNSTSQLGIKQVTIEI